MKTADMIVDMDRLRNQCVTAESKETDENYGNIHRKKFAARVSRGLYAGGSASVQ